MSEKLISADKLIMALESMQGKRTHATIENIIYNLKIAPAVDAEPVRHGEWKERYENGRWYYDCPFCDDGYATNERQEHPENYCSNCGAKMDGKEKES